MQKMARAQKNQFFKNKDLEKNIRKTNSTKQIKKQTAHKPSFLATKPKKMKAPENESIFAAQFFEETEEYYKIDF